MTRHIHADLIHAWADGAEIQWQEEDGTWHDLENPTWGASCVYRSKPRQPVRLSDEEILAVAEKYGTSSTRHKPTYHLHDGSPTGETYPITDWEIGQEDLLGFARELLEKADE